jgi:hypothetical protein
MNGQRERSNERRRAASERKGYMTSGKRRQTFSKMTRERTVKERRERKQEKKDEKKAAALEEGAEKEPLSEPTPEGEVQTG